MLRVLGTLLVFVITISMANVAHACSCSYKANIAEQSAIADLIFLGRALETFPNPHPTNTADFGNEFRYTFDNTISRFEVLHAFKGNLEETIDIVHDNSSSVSCGMTFTIGEVQIVYVSYSKNGALSTGHCLKGIHFSDFQNLLYFTFGVNFKNPYFEQHRDIYRYNPFDEKELFRQCKRKNLRSINDVASISEEAKAILDGKMAGMTPEKQFQTALDFNDDRTEFKTSDKGNEIMIYILRKAADNGSVSAQSEIAASLMFCYQGVEQNFDKGLAMALASAADGDPYSLESLGVLFSAGIGVEKNVELGLDYLQQCAEKGMLGCENKIFRYNDWNTRQIELRRIKRNNLIGYMFIKAIFLSFPH